MTAAERDHEARRWLGYAIEDLTAARALTTIAGVSPRMACYMSQQAAEKALKAALVLAAVPVPRTHDLPTLVKLVPAGWAVALPASDLVDLTGWAVAARYPDVAADEATAIDAHASIATAHRVVEATRADLVTYGTSAGP